MAAWAFSRLPLLPRAAGPLGASSEVEKFAVVAERYSQLEDDFKKRPAVLVAAYYLRSPWSDTELARLVKEETDRGLYPEQQTLDDLIAALNAEGTSASPGRRKSRKRRQRR